MNQKVTIFGKNSWPHTSAAREAYASENRSVDYVSVIDDPHVLKKMLALSKGQRKIPVIVDGERVIVGYQGKGWTIWIRRLDAILKTTAIDLERLITVTGATP